MTSHTREPGHAKAFARVPGRDHSSLWLHAGICRHSYWPNLIGHEILERYSDKELPCHVADHLGCHTTGRTCPWQKGLFGERHFDMVESQSVATG